MTQIADIHILTLPGRESWLQDSLTSLSQQPCDVHVCPGILGATGQARYEAFELGRSPYVGYVDDDDLVEPGAVQACLDALERHPEAVGAFTDEILIDSAGETIGQGFSTGREWTPKRHLGSLMFVHHLWIGRREIVEKYRHVMRDMPIGAHWALTCLMALDGPWIHLPIVGYRWRIHPHGSHQTRRPPVDLLQISANIRQQWKDAGVISD